MKKILGAGLAGGIVVFLWGFVSHMLLPIGEMGLRQMPVNSPLLEAMKQSLPEEGLYAFPGKEVGRKQTEAEDAVWTSKYKMGPTGLLLYHPDGTEPISPKRLGLQLATDIFGALLLAYLLVAIAGSTGAQVPLSKMLRISAVAGLFSWASIEIAYWNWYGFPCGFVLAELIDQLVGWTLAGLVMALLWRRSERRAIRQAERVWES
ncbi:MAG: hypothetical protein ABIV06_09105 [Thermoanaerobaculia bacterium]